MAGEGDEAARAELVELIERANVHDEGVDAEVHALHVRDGDGVVRQCPGHVLGHQVVEVLRVIEVVALRASILVSSSSYIAQP